MDRKTGRGPPDWNRQIGAGSSGGHGGAGSSEGHGRARGSGGHGGTGSSGGHGGTGSSGGHGRSSSGPWPRSLSARPLPPEPLLRVSRGRQRDLPRTAGLGEPRTAASSPVNGGPG